MSYKYVNDLYYQKERTSLMNILRMRYFIDVAGQQKYEYTQEYKKQHRTYRKKSFYVASAIVIQQFTHSRFILL